MNLKRNSFNNSSTSAVIINTENIWVKIFGMDANKVLSIDMKYGNARFEADLPDGMYTVKTFHLGDVPIQEFIIGKP
jgi:hypothetical protein